MVSSLLVKGAVLIFFAVILFSGCADPKDEHLWIASMKGDQNAATMLINSGADPNYVRGGHSILMRVARTGRGDIAALLIASGAKINFRGKDGASALTVAAEFGNAPVTRVLIAKGADINIRNDHGNTALMYAAENGHSDIVSLLLAAGADSAVVDKDGETALMIAQRRRDQAIVKLLVQAKTH